jgi:hypothetical protein
MKNRIDRNTQASMHRDRGFRGTFGIAVILVATFLWQGSLSAQNPTKGLRVPHYAIKNSHHYRESGVGNATGRSGSATMTARALMGKDGNTTIELTTGTLDSSVTPRGSVAGVQFKPLNPAGTPIISKTFGPLSTPAGYYSFTWPSLYRSQQVQLQGLIRGIDANRTNVVTVVETVKMRPDLYVDLLPNYRVNTNETFNITATVFELNGEASATTNCLLFVDGNLADRANNVYVDAWGIVSCLFTARFSTPGTHTIQVTAADVVPADWDNENNSRSATVEVLSPDTAYVFAYFIGDDDSVSDFSYHSKVWRGAELIAEDVGNQHRVGRSQTASLSLATSPGGQLGNPNAILWKFPVCLEYTEFVDGTVVSSVIKTDLTGYDYRNEYGDGSFQIGSRGDNVLDNGTMAFLDSYQTYDASGTLVAAAKGIWALRLSGDVTYVSNGYSCTWWTSQSGTCSSPSDYYFWNSESRDVNGTMIPSGTVWQPNLRTVDANGVVFGTEISVPLTTRLYIFENDYPWHCDTGGPFSDGSSYEMCSSTTGTATRTEGYAQKPEIW